MNKSIILGIPCFSKENPHTTLYCMWYCDPHNTTHTHTRLRLQWWRIKIINGFHCHFLRPGDKTQPVLLMKSVQTKLITCSRGMKWIELSWGLSDSSRGIRGDGRTKGAHDYTKAKVGSGTSITNPYGLRGIWWCFPQDLPLGLPPVCEGHEFKIDLEDEVPLFHLPL